MVPGQGTVPATEAGSGADTIDELGLGLSDEPTPGYLDPDDAADDADEVIIIYADNFSDVTNQISDACANCHRVYRDVPTAAMRCTPPQP